MQPEVQVRQEEPDDSADVRRLHRAAFGEEHGTVVAALVDDLRSAAAGACGLSLVAEHEGRVVGHVLFTRSLLDAPARLVEVSVLSPLGVLPERQGEGIGSRLVREGLAVLAGRAAVPLVFLEGAPGYYSRLGFRPAVELGFRKPSLRIPDAAFQVAHLGADQPGLSGTLVYAHAFWDHDAVGLRDSPTTSGAAAVRKQYHFWPSSGGVDAWDVGRLITLTAGLPPEQVALDDLPEIDQVYWFDDWQRPTVRSVAEHVRLVRDVDTSWPIILGPDGRVMDGMHRVVRALLEGRVTITAVRLPVLPEPDFRDCRPQDLPY